MYTKSVKIFDVVGRVKMEMITNLGSVVSDAGRRWRKQLENNGLVMTTVKIAFLRVGASCRQ